jgi:hypothetical protein
MFREIIAEGAQCRVADVMFDPLSVRVCRLCIDAKRDQKVTHHAMALSRRSRQLTSLVGKKDRAIRLARHQPVAPEPLDRIVDGGVGHSKATGQIDGTRLAPLLDEIGNKLDIVFRELSLMRVADVSEPLGLPDDPLFVIIAIRHSLLLYAAKVYCGENGRLKKSLSACSKALLKTYWPHRD